LSKLSLYSTLMLLSAFALWGCNNSPKKAQAESEDSISKQDITSEEDRSNKQSEEEEITLLLNGYELSFGEWFKLMSSSDDNDGYILSYKNSSADIRFYSEEIPDGMEDIYELSCQKTSSMELNNLTLQGQICTAKPEYYYYFQNDNTRIILYIKSEESFIKENESNFRSIFSNIRKAGIAS